MITYDLAGKTALVTGSNRGIGKAMADALEAAGAKVVRTSSKDCDLSDRNAVYAFIESCANRRRSILTSGGTRSST